VRERPRLTVAGSTDYQTLMAPALQALADGAEQPVSQLRGAIAKQIGLTDDDLKAGPCRADRLCSPNRRHWTITYLHQAGLVTVQVQGHRIGVLYLDDFHGQLVEAPAAYWRHAPQPTEWRLVPVQGYHFGR
jgi:restriction endonuclease Mrr